jgi:plastocyanin
MDRIRATLTIIIVLGLAGCAAARIEGAAQPLPAGGYGVTLDLVNFAFRPNVITVEAGRPVTIAAVSTSIARRNVTIISFEGELLADVDVPSRQTRTFEATFREPGTYELYCDVGMHRSLGMEGVFVGR